MEELNLEDLQDFGGELNLFPADPIKELQNKPGAESSSAQPDDKKETLSDGSGEAGQESVATDKDKNKSQVQAGETADGEGGNSSSPKLNNDEQLYSTLAAQFKANGVLPGLEDVNTIKSLEDIHEAMKKEVESRFDSRSKRIEEAMKLGLPANEVSEQIEVIDRLKKITPEYIASDEALEFRRTAIIQDALAKGYSQARAEKMAQRSIDDGTDIEDANDSVKAIITKEETELNSIIQAAKDKENESINGIKDYISNNKAIIGGIELSQAQSDELYKQITTDLGNKENAFMLAQKKDPIGSRVKLEALFYLTKGLTDFSVFQNAAETRVSNNVENLLRGASFTQGGSLDTEVQDTNSSFTLADLKDLEFE